LLDALRGAGAALLIDAASSGAPPGTLRRLDAAAGPLPASLRAASTHALGLVQAIELGRVLGALPPHLRVYAVEGQDFGPGEGLSPAVARAADEAARQVLEEVARLL